MKCDIYKSGNLRNAYLFVPAGSPPESCVTESVLGKLGSLSFFKTIEFDSDSPLIAADPNEVIQNIEKHGFHVQGAEVRVKTKVQEVSEAGAAIGGGILAASLGLGPIGAIVGAAIGAILASSAKGEKNEPDA